MPSSPESTQRLPGLSAWAQAVLDSAMDAVVMVDSDGLIVLWNKAAAVMFGYDAEEILGQDMAAFIIPDSLRQRHRDAFARSDLNQAGSILGRRIEVTGQRRDGTIFPVELTITRTDLDRHHLFTGYLRDITERHQLLEDLRQSRERLVEVSDQTRRRIERDLHDGAQQQLVGAAMAVTQARAGLGDDPVAAERLLTMAAEVLVAAIADIRELASGVLPAVLADHGLQPALAELARRSPIPVDIDIIPVRWPATVETSLYFLAAEALTNAAKHGAANVVLRLTSVSEPGMVLASGSSADPPVIAVCTITDDGPGGAQVGRGTGLLGLQDRMTAVGGTLVIDSPIGRGTRIEGRIPIAAPYRDDR